MEPIGAIAAVYKRARRQADEGRASRKSPEEIAMALEIIESCVNCYACEPLCPNEAIYQASPHFLIDPDKCTECLGDYDDAQCSSICPIEGAIVDELGVALNLPGSLTGISSEMLAMPGRGGSLPCQAALEAKTG
jgi:ferredoxin